MITVANRSQIANRQSAIANPRPTELAGALKRGLGRGAQRRRGTPSKTIVFIPFSTPPSDLRSNG
ncbi:MAG: hypothetical protein IID06_11470 [Gemmatimonadetes bacterium]|nr:hypothetical protein [Gemmatimonadota bacterium]